MDPTARFAELVTMPEDEIRLDMGALLIAAHAHPNLDLDDQLGRIDRLAESCTEASVAGLARHLFVTLGFRGNTVDYGDPLNSFLDSVLERRVGIPISLSVLMIEVGRRLQLDLFGVGMPGHFLVGTPGGDLYDPFDQGRLLTVDEARARFDQLHGGRLEFAAGMLSRTGPRAILARMLANLKTSFRSRSPAGALWSVRLMLTIPGLAPVERARLGTVLGEMSRFDEAASALESAAEGLSSAESDDALRRAREFRARLN